MDFEQILIRLGIDAKAVVTGLTRTSSLVKGWATNLVHDLKHHALGSLGGLYIFDRIFEGIKEKALFINRTTKETGLSSNFIQGMSNELGYVGESFEEISKPLGRFNVLIGQAKEGIPAARQKLIEWGIATKSENWNTLNATTSIKRLAEQFDKLGDHEKKAALLQAVYGKSWQAMFPIFEQGAKKLKEMDESHWYDFMTNKMSERTLDTLGQAFKVGKVVGGGILGFVANLLTAGIGITMRSLEVSFTDWSKNAFGHMTLGQVWKYMLFGTKTEEQKHNEALKDKKTLLEGNLEIVKLTNEQAKLANELADRHKGTVGQLADRAREIMGNRMPRGLRSIHAITPAMASALKIQTLEDRAEVANAYGDDALRKQFTAQADRLRLSNSSLTSAERDPTKIAREHLEVLNEQLGRMKGEDGGVKVDEINNHDK